LTSQPQDTGLTCLVLMARFYHLPADPGQLQHRYGKPGLPFSTTEIVHAGRSLGLKVQATRTDWQRLQKTALPAVVPHADGAYCILVLPITDKS